MLIQSAKIIVYGEDTTLNPNDYTISLKTENGNTLDYTLQDGDLAFEDGTPTTTGTFKVVLSEAGLKNIEDKYGTQNYTYTSTGNGLFTINAAIPTVALTGNASQVYNGEAIPNYQVTATVTGPDTEQTITLSGDDLEYVDASGNVSTTAPVNVGNYTVQLSESGKKKVAAVNSSNLNWTDFDWTKIGTPTYDITKATATVTTTGSQSATYTGSPVKINLSDFVSTVSTNNGLTVTIPTDQVTAGDYEITDANGNVVTDPTAAGTYTVKLTADGLKKLESNTDNYDWTSTGQGTLTITPAVPAVTVDASASKVYDGSAIADYAPQVTITAPGASQVTLTSGDYEFNVDDTWTTTAPVNAGSYEVRLTDSGLAKIKAVNSTNFDWNNVTPAVSGDYTIEKADAVISLDDSQKQTASYTGSAAVIDPSYFIPSIEDTTNDKTLSASDLNLTASDYEFVDANSQAITKGTYYVRLTESGIQKVQDAVFGNSNYNWTYTGHGLYVIDESVPTITITATTGKDGKVYDGKPGEITNDGYTVTIKNPDGDVITTLDGSSLQFKDATTPTDVGTYQVELTPEAIEKLKEEYPNYNWDNASHVTGSYEISKDALTVNFTGSQTKPYTGQSQNYDPSGSVMITSNNGLTITVSELTNSDLSYTPADHVNVGVYKVQLTQAALDNILNGVGSQNYTASFGTNEATLTITSEEGTVETKHVTRTIIFNLPNGTKPQIVQDAELSRTVTTEEPSGEVTYGEWNTGKWDAYTDILQVAGYTANPASIAEVSVNDDTTNILVEFNYTPNEQTGKISYVDNDTGKEITSTDLTGKTDETVPVDAESGVPAGWKSVPGQDIPTSVTATADGIPTVTVKIEHATIVVTHDDPKTPNDRLPDGTKTGDNYSNPGKYPSGVSESDLNRTVTRTINVMDPLTGQVTYSDWIQSGENGWIEFTPMEVTGYTASPAVVPAEMVTADTKDATVVIKYSLNSKPEQPTNPDQPDNPNKPAQPTGPAVPNQPGEPAKPVQPNTPITPDNQGQANYGSQSSTVTTEGSNESSSTSPTSSMGVTTKEDQSTDQQAKQLPQTGNEQNHSLLLGLLGLGFAGLLGLGKRKKKEDQ